MKRDFFGGRLFDPFLVLTNWCSMLKDCDYISSFSILKINAMPGNTAQKAKQRCKQYQTMRQCQFSSSTTLSI